MLLKPVAPNRRSAQTQRLLSALFYFVMLTEQKYLVYTTGENNSFSTLDTSGQPVVERFG
ncbi:hypothetical protein DPMN_103566 [Dreissena polymorpha]|uniref:Uncharacterized protein n=1 Tax=Dreissena polymorpha TaxID=45954 RepID=A0A9D4HA04_DREPO|nr:hypothetical protein DPMN_103566 [Dreissena polymorpha]